MYRQSGSSLKAANGSSIKTYGLCTIQLRLASRQYEWNFIIADVARLLLGADFLRANSLLVDLKGKRLYQITFRTTKKHSGCSSIPIGNTGTFAPHLDTISVSTNKYNMLLAEFPDITVPNFSQPSTVWNILSPPRDHQYMHMLSAYLRTSWHWTRLNSTE